MTARHATRPTALTDAHGTSVPVVLGIAVAVTAIVVLDAPLASRILLAGPLVVVPALAPLHHAVPRPLASPVAWAMLVAAAPLLAAFALPAGALAAALTVPWLAAAGGMALLAIRDGVPHLRAIVTGRGDGVGGRDLRTLRALTADAALGYLAVGAAFATAERAGFAPLGFDPVIILLTAVHFHFAGFGLVLAGAHVARGDRPRMATLAAVVLAAGMPITAIGFTTRSEEIGAVGAAVVVVGAVLVAIGLVRWRRSLALGAAWLAIGVPFGLAWAVAQWLDVPFLGLDGMIAVHGTLNAVGVLVTAVLLARDPGLRSGSAFTERARRPGPAVAA